MRMNMAVVGWISLKKTTSSGMRWLSALNFELNVNFASLRKPKKANVMADQNIIETQFVVAGNASIIWKSFKWWIVIGSRTLTLSPCDRFIPRGTSWRRNIF